MIDNPGSDDPQHVHSYVLTYSRPFWPWLWTHKLWHVRCWTCELDDVYGREAAARAVHNHLVAEQRSASWFPDSHVRIVPISELDPDRRRSDDD